MPVGTSSTVEQIKSALQCGNPRCDCHRGPNRHCPAHTDNNPSLTVHADANGKVLVNCKTGCTQEAVIAALKERGLWASPERAAPDKPSPDFPVATYEYRDATGKVIAVKGRFERAEIDPATKKPLKVFKWRLPNSDKWTLAGMPISAIPLWGADLLPDIPYDVRVFVVEGEKAAQGCRAVGLFAVCHPGGAGTKDFGESFEALRGRDVVLWPDNDDPGRKFMDLVKAQLRSVARSIVTIFPPVPDKGDAVEFFGSGHSVADLMALVPSPPRPVLEYLSCEDGDGCEFKKHGLGYQAVFREQMAILTIDQLRRSSGELRGEVLVESVAPTIPEHLYWGSIILSSGANREKLAKILDNRTKGLNIDWDGIIEVVARKVALAERQGEPFGVAGDMDGELQTSDWLVSNFAPRLEPTTIWGDGGVGKSMLTLALGISVKAGVEIVPGFSPAVKGNVLYLDWEASRQRLDSRIKRICAGAGIQPVTIGYRRCNAPLVDQIAEVLRYVQSEGVVLVIIDSVEMAMNGTGGDGSNPNDKVIVLHSALRLLGSTTILIDHINAVGRERNGGAGKPIGGVYKTNLARMAFELRKGATPIQQGQINLGLYNMKRNDDGALLKAVGLKVTFGDSWTKYERDGITDDGLMAGLKTRERMVAVLMKKQPLTNRELAALANASLNSVNVELSRNNGTIFTKLEAGGWVLCSQAEEPQEVIPF